ncbi:hypothetical protein [Streptomyces sp. ISL-11]|uniref:hypothetical protein n=1 Tax=Streptomyces sp. ISL-11 TaxID=2819174 RepID=UPI001BE89C5F|nr:hypothetical protein [Streptomyces sp. ISL-11]MBT2383107.1 hypothetical protein [Streptomyces sp. ISL-11]
MTCRASSLTDWPHLAVQAGPAKALCAPKGVARQGVLTVLRPDPHPTGHSNHRDGHRRTAAGSAEGVALTAERRKSA